MTTTFTIDWALAGQTIVCAIVLCVLIGALFTLRDNRDKYD